MPTIDTASPHEIKIESAIITSDRFTDAVEISQNISEMNIYESLNNPFLTGNVLFTDSTNLLNLINFQGTERLTVRLKINDDDTAKSVVKNFIITDFKFTPTHDTSEAVNANFVEDIKYLDNNSTVSKAFSGKPQNIIENILNGYLNKEVFRKYVHPHNSSMSYIAPSISPLDVCMTIKDRMATPNGMPYFLYSTLNSDKIFLSDLETILQESTVNTTPYMYGQAHTRWMLTQNVLARGRNVESYNLPSSENMLKMGSQGVLNSTYQFVDANGSNSGIKINMDEILKSIENANFNVRGQRGKIYDDMFMMAGKRLAEHQSSNISQIVSSNSYNNTQGYYENDRKSQALSLVARAMRYYLLKSPLEIKMPGFYFLGRGDDITIGRKIFINFLRNDPNVLQISTDRGLDKKRSGEYIVNTCRHLIQPTNYSVSISCVKLFNQLG